LGGNVMKKLLALACVASLICVGTAFSEPIEFPNGITVDVAPGWSYEGEGNSIMLLAEDESCSIAIVVSEAEGFTSEEAAKTMSIEHKGTEPKEIENNTYEYSFKNEKGVVTRVFVEVENGKLKVLSITGEHKDADGIIDSITENK
jgi:hypothetical protein